jgi:uncharacterized protein (UPF0548 family)
MLRKPIDRFRAKLVRKPRIYLEAGTFHSPSEVLLPGAEQSTEMEKKAVGSESSQDGDRLSDSVPLTAVNPPSAYSSSTVPQSLAGKRQGSGRQIRRRVLQGIRALAMPVFWISLLAFCGGTGVAAFLWLTTLPPLPDCKNLAPLASDTEKLYCTEQAARSGTEASVLAALDLVRNWTADHPLHTRTEPLVNQWSRVILANARAKADQDKLESAIALARKIPARSALYKETQTTVKGWQQDLEQGRSKQGKLEAALQAQDWKAAEEQLQLLSSLDTPYWKQHRSRLRQKVLTERISHQQLQQARQIAGDPASNLESVGQAIALLEQISPDTYVYPEVKQELDRLTQTLVEMAVARLTSGAGAIAAAQYLPSSIPLPDAARDLFWVSRAQPLAGTKLPDQPALDLLWQLWMVLPQVQQIGGVSPLLPQAQTLTPQLEQQIRSLTALQVARSLANLKQIPTLQTAIQLAQAVPLGNPQRLYAQTLIAQWQKEAQQLEDLPYLIAAQQTAATATIPQLQAAIAQASRIAPGRALRPNAQALIFHWQQQVQTIEDKPILDKARGLAKQKKLKQAIEVAAQIQAGRALHREARSVIQSWTREIQIAEDRPILDQAYGLEAQGNLSQAIDIAYQIQPGRALYEEAQSAISRWSAELEAIARSRQPEPSNTPAAVPSPDLPPEQPAIPDPQGPFPPIPPPELPPP